MNNDPLVKFQDKFMVDQLVLRTYNYWKLSVRPVQLTLGAMLLSLSRDCVNLADLTENEVRELHLIFSEIDCFLKKAFRPDKINYCAFMMVDPLVHFHVFPRYSSVREFHELHFQDNFWPGPITDYSGGNFSDDFLLRLRAKILEEL